MINMSAGSEIKAAKRLKRSKLSVFMSQLPLQLMILPGLLVFIIFEYVPMYGITIAFRNYMITDSIFTAPWAGLRHFHMFLRDPMFFTVLRNTLGINLLGLAIGFPAPIIFALFLNELRNERFKRLTQTISYLPHFISWVIFGGLVINILSPETGVLNKLLVHLNLIQEPIFFIGQPQYFWFIAVFSGLIKGLGWGAILYLAAMAGVDPQLYEAAIVDGAGRFKRMWHITLPTIMGTTVILFIFAISGILSSGFEQIWMLQNPLNISTSEVIDTYVYKIGIQQGRFSYATAVGLMRSVIAVILVVSANATSKKFTEKGLF